MLVYAVNFMLVTLFVVTSSKRNNIA